MIVVKVGGGKDLHVDAIADDIAALTAAGTPLILVHGGAETTNEVAEALGHPPEFVTSESGFVSRRTDRRTLEIFEMVYCGQLNKMWVEALQRRGVNAVGLSGLDGRVFEGKRRTAARQPTANAWCCATTGRARSSVNTGLLRLLLNGGYFPC